MELGDILIVGGGLVGHRGADATGADLSGPQGMEALIDDDSDLARLGAALLFPRQEKRKIVRAAHLKKNAGKFNQFVIHNPLYFSEYNLLLLSHKTFFSYF